MYSVVEISGKQYNVKKGDVISVDKLDEKEDTKVEFTNVLLINDGKDNVQIGTPYIENAKVEVKVIEHARDKKVQVFKFKRRKNYKRLRGHKQHYTTIEIKEIVTA